MKHVTCNGGIKTKATSFVSTKCSLKYLFVQQRQQQSKGLGHSFRSLSPYLINLIWCGWIKKIWGFNFGFLGTFWVDTSSSNTFLCFLFFSLISLFLHCFLCFFTVFSYVTDISLNHIWEEKPKLQRSCHFSSNFTIYIQVNFLLLIRSWRNAAYNDCDISLNYNCGQYLSLHANLQHFSISWLTTKDSLVIGSLLVVTDCWFWLLLHCTWRMLLVGRFRRFNNNPFTIYYILLIILLIILLFYYLRQLFYTILFSTILLYYFLTIWVLSL